MNSSASKLWEVGAEALGYVGLVASWRRPTPENTKQPWPMVVIQCCAETEDGAHTPAQSITVGSREGLLALRRAVDAALGEELVAAPTVSDPELLAILKLAVDRVAYRPGEGPAWWEQARAAIAKREGTKA